MTYLVYDPIFLEHETGAHPERADRLRTLTAEFESRGLFQKCKSFKFKPVDEAALLRLHSLEQLRIAQETSEVGGHIAEDTVCSPRSYDVALRAAGACIAGVDAVLGGKAKTSFSIVRPPGHHATPNRSMGFCLFNNVALAADHARTKYGIKRSLIVDWDVHHGNGTQDIFYADPSVTFLSIHRYGSGFYPGTGSADETGSGAGLGHNINVPLRANTNRQTYLDCFRSAVESTADRVRPDLILISAGFDAHQFDPIGCLGLESEDFGTMTEVVLNVAKTHTSGRIVSCLEGGYHLQALAESASIHVENLFEFDGVK